MKSMADYIHSLGLKAGIYSDAGENTCAHVYDNPEGNCDGLGVGLYGHDEEDLNMYLLDWNYDFIKVDWCGGLSMGLDEKKNVIRRLGKSLRTFDRKRAKMLFIISVDGNFPESGLLT